VAFVVLLDACVLYSNRVRDTLLWMASAGIYEFRWTEMILEEAQRNILQNTEGLDSARLNSTFDSIRRAFPDGEVTNFESLIPVMTNDPKDRHVLAAAVASRSAVIVTDNVRDFPAASVAMHDIDIQTPDEFARYSFEVDVERGLSALRRQANRKRRPPVTVEELLAHLEAVLPTYVAAVRDELARRSPD
jgi:predicted nucleic acid-binding protein